MKNGRRREVRLYSSLLMILLFAASCSQGGSGFDAFVPRPEPSTDADFQATNYDSEPIDPAWLINSVVTVSSATVPIGSTAELRLELRDGLNQPVTTVRPAVAFVLNGGTSEFVVGQTVAQGGGVFTSTLTGMVPGTALNVRPAVGGNFYTGALPSLTVTVLPPMNLTYSQMVAVYTDSVPIVANIPSSAGGPVASYALDLSTPSLPSGLTLDPITGLIIGTPNAVTAPAMYRIVATNLGGSDFVDIMITVLDRPPNIAYTASSYTYTEGAGIATNTPSNTGGAITSCTSVPDLSTIGLTLNNTTCAISGGLGTPTTVVYPPVPFVITAENSGGSSVFTLTLRVNDTAPGGLSYSTNPAVYSRTVAIANNTPSIAIGDPPAAFGPTPAYSVTPALPAGLNLNATTGIISGTPSGISPVQTYTVTASNTGGSTTTGVQIRVNDIPAALTYAPVVLTKGVTIPVAIAPGNTGGAVVSCTPVGFPAGVSVDSQCRIIGMPTALSVATNYTVNATNTGGTFPFTVNITVNDKAPNHSYVPNSRQIILNTPLAPAISLTNTGGGGAITGCSWVTPALAGVTLNSDCSISSAPTVAGGPTLYTVLAENTGGTQNISITIEVLDVSPDISYAGTVTYNNGDAISFVPINTGGLITSCSVTPILTAPTLISKGLAVGADCRISGIASGTIFPAAQYSVFAQNAAGDDTAILTLEIKDNTPVISYGYPAPHTRNRDSGVTTITPSNTGGVVTTCGASQIGAAPTLLSLGLSIDNDCVISGNPTTTTAGADYSVTAINSGGSDTKNVRIVILPKIPAMTLANQTVVQGNVISEFVPINTGDAATTCNLVAGSLYGLTLNSDCRITGTPSVLGSNVVTLRPINAGGTGANFSFTLTSKDKFPVISYGAAVTLTRSSGTGLPIIPTATGGAVTGCAGSVPPGLTLNSNCSITGGTPTTPSALTNYAITASNEAGTQTQVVYFSAQVDDIPPVLAYPPTALLTRNSVGTINPSSLTGGTPVSCTGALPAGLSLNPTTCVISGTPTAVGSASYTITPYSLGNIAGTPQSITITVQEAAPSISYASPSYTYTRDTPIANLNVTNTGGAIPLTGCAVVPPLPNGLTFDEDTCAVTGTPLSGPGVPSVMTPYTVTATNPAGSSSTLLNILVRDIAPSFTYSTPVTITRGTPVTLSLATSTGGPIIACSGTPPDGMILSSDCVISGTPTTVAGPTLYTMTATSQGGQINTGGVTITVRDAAPVISYASASYTYTRDAPIANLNVINTGGVVQAAGCSVAPPLPNGLTLDATTCEITGTPLSGPGVPSVMTPYTVTALNPAGTSSTLLNILVRDIAPVFTYTTPVTITRDAATTLSLASNTGGAIISCSGAPPVGMTLSAACVLSGTPTVSAAATLYTMMATSQGGLTNTADVTITVAEPVPAIAYLGSSYSIVKATLADPSDIRPVSSAGTITSCSSAPPLPAGLTLNQSNCRLEGSHPNAVAMTPYQITASNISGPGPVAILNLQISNIAPTFSYPGEPFLLTKGEAVTLLPAGSGIISCAGTVPPGMNLDTGNCVISGAPNTVAASTGYGITATAVGPVDTPITVNFTIQDSVPAITQAAASFTRARGVGGTTTIATNSGGTMTACGLVAGSLPNGLTLAAVANTCELSGTPAAGVSVPSLSTPYQVRASNGTGDSNVVIMNLAVDDIAPVVTFPATATWTRGTALTLASSPAPSGGAIVNCTVSGAPAGITVNTSNCTLSGTPTSAAGPFTVDITPYSMGGVAGATQTITVTLEAEAPVITLSATSFTRTRDAGGTTTIATNTGGTMTACELVAGSLPNGLTLSAVANTCELSGTPIAGVSVPSLSTPYQVRASNAAGNSNVVIMNLAVNDIAPVVTFPATATWTRGTSLTLASFPAPSGGAIVNCTLSGAPAGITVNTSNCTLSGTPTSAAGPFTVDITPYSMGGVAGATQTITVTLQDALPVLAYGSASYTVARNVLVNGAAITPTNSGGAIQAAGCVALDALPNGLSVDSNTCQLLGTPTLGAGVPSVVAPYRVQATGAAGDALVILNLAVNDIAPTLAYAGGPIFTMYVGTAVSMAPSVSPAAITGCSGPVPAGLTLHSDCRITGTPTTIENINPTLTASSLGGATGTYSPTFDVRVAAPILSLADPPAWTKNQAVALTATNTGGAATSCTGTPPAGLLWTLNAGTCDLTGNAATPSVLTPYTLTATNATGSSSIVLQAQVNDDAPTLSYVGVPDPITIGTYYTFNATTGGGTITSCTGAVPPGMTLDAQSCTIYGAPTTLDAAGTTYTITATALGGANVAYSFNLWKVRIAAPTLAWGSSSYTATVGSGFAQSPTLGGGAIPSGGCAIAPPQPAGMTFDPDTCAIGGTPAAGTAQALTAYTVTATNTTDSASAVFNLSINDVAPVLNFVPSILTWTVNTAVNAVPTITGAGTVISCSLIGGTLPAGVSVNPTTCALYGAPTATGAHSPQIRAVALGGAGTNQTLTITVNPQLPSIAWSSTYSAKVGMAFSATPTLGGGPVQTNGCTILPPLPVGITIDDDTCVISGTPAAGMAQPLLPYVVSAENASGIVTSIFNLLVDDVAPTLTYSAATFNIVTNTTDVSETPTIVGAGTVIGCAVDSGALPNGLTLNPLTCAITGRPTLAGTYTPTIRASARGGDFTDSALTFNVAVEAPKILWSASSYTASVGVAFSATPTLSGGAISPCTAPGGLPAWASVDPITCEVTGTPVAGSSQPMTPYLFTVSNATSSSSSIFNLIVNDVAPTVTYSLASFTALVVGTAFSEVPVLGGGDILVCGIQSGSLPSGLVVNAADCTISGTPLASQVATPVTIRGMARGGAFVDVPLSFTVEAQAPSLVFGSASYTGTVQSAVFSALPTLSGGAIVPPCVALDALPAWATLNVNTCEITASGAIPYGSAQPVTPYRIEVTNASGSSMSIVNILVNDVAPNTSYAVSVHTISKDAPFSLSAVASTEGVVISCALQSGTLPPGLSVHPTTCAVTGTPTALGGYAPVIRISARGGALVDRSLTFTVTEGSPSIATVTPQAGLSAGGEPITISGSLFQVGATARIDGNDCATTTVIDSNTITCVTPVMTGTVSLLAVEVENPDTLTATKPNGFLALGAPAMWLRADAGISTSGGKVIFWSDQSGSGSHGQQLTLGNAPTPQAAGINGKPSVRFNGATQRMQLMNLGALNAAAGATTVFVSSTSSGSEQTLLSYEASAANGLPILRVSAFDTMTAEQGDAAPGGDLSFGGARDSASAYENVRLGTVPVSTPFLGSATWNMSTNTLNTYFDRVVATDLSATFQNLSVASMEVADAQTATLGALMTSGTGTSQYWDGDLAEIFLYNTALTALERQALENYLRTKYSTP